MRRFLAVVTIVFALFNSQGLTAHAAPQHDMETMEHANNSMMSTSCLTLCSTVVLNKHEDQYLIQARKEDEPTEPSPTLTQTQIYWMLSQREASRAGFYTKFEPPPRQKPYIAFSVFRV